MSQQVFFISETEYASRFAVSILNAAIPEADVIRVFNDSPDALRVLVDVPTGFAIRQLEAWERWDATRTLVVTANSNPLYSEVLWDAGVLSVVTPVDAAGVVAGRFAEAVRGRRSGRPAPRMLSPREARVLRLALAGRDSKGVAEALNVSPKAVNSHVSSVLRAVGAPDRVALVALVLGGAA